MEKDRQTKIIAIVALFIGVATLTLGFATFSAKLIIQSKAIVKIDADSFKVLLSKEENSVVTGSVTPKGTGAVATISNDDVPTISNLKADFVNPGEKVIYEFFAVNVGDYDAYLNKIDYENIEGQTVNKICTAGEHTTNSYVQSACNSIRITVQVAEDKACATSIYKSHILSNNNVGEKVIVTIEYNKDGVRADGPFSVAFGDITLNYSTIDSETSSVPECANYETAIATNPMETKGRANIIDADGDGKISKSDKVTLGSESFYVISADESAKTVTMLAEWNLNVGNNMASGKEGMQNSTCRGWFSYDIEPSCTLPFSSTNYWDGNVPSYPDFVYNNNDIIKPHVENYVKELKKLGYNSVTGRLIKYEEMIDLGCSTDGSAHACDWAVEWAKNTSYWIGSARNANDVWDVSTNGCFGIDNAYTTATDNGVRPVITIKASEI